MKRSCLALTAATSLLIATAPTLALADSPTLNTSYAAAAKVTPGGGLTPQVTTAGLIGQLLDFLTPVLNQVVTPLTTQLTALPSTVVGDVVSGLTGAGYTATSPSSAQAAPASGYPTCTSGGWTPNDCYGPLIPAISVDPLLGLGTGTLQGYASADSTGSYAGAGTAGVALSLLGLPVGNLGVANASSSCLASRVCSSTATLTNLSLLGGAIAAKTASDGSLQVALRNSSTFVALSTLSSPTSVSGAGLTAQVQAQGPSLVVTIGFTLDNLLSALGIANVLSSLNASVVSAAVNVSLTIGPGTLTATDTTSAWGLEVGVGLTTNIQLSILGLVTVGVVVTDGSTNGNVVDLKLGYTSAANADQTVPSGAPPALT